MPVEGRTKGKPKRGGTARAVQGGKESPPKTHDVTKASRTHREMAEAADTRKDLEDAAVRRNVKEGAGKANDPLLRKETLKTKRRRWNHCYFSLR